MTLNELGFSALAERVYRALIDEPTASVARLAQLVCSDEERVRSELAVLVGLGVGRADESHPSGVVLRRPGAALEALIAQVEEDLLRRFRQVGHTRAELVWLAGRFASRQAPDTAEGLERLADLDAVRETLAELSFFTRTSVYSVQPGGALDVEALAASRPLDLRALRRGVDMRVIYDAAVLDDEPTRGHLRVLEEGGAQLRVTDHAFERMVIMDEQVAVIPIAPHNSDRGALVVRQAGLLAGFLELFHRMWRDAERISWPGRGAEIDAAEPELSEDDRRVLKLLASGSTDEAAARVIGVSVRHLRRRVAKLMDRFGAGSRFEAGVEAAHRGWI